VGGGRGVKHGKDDDCADYKVGYFAGRSHAAAFSATFSGKLALRETGSESFRGMCSLMMLFLIVLILRELYCF
jgi:hypothetical protein